MGTNTSSPQTVTSGTLTTLVPDEWLYGTGTRYNASCTAVPQSPFTDIGGSAVQQDAAYDQATTVTGYSVSYSISNNSIGTYPYTLQLLGMRPSATAPVTVKAKLTAGWW